MRLSEENVVRTYKGIARAFEDSAIHFIERLIQIYPDGRYLCRTGNVIFVSRLQKIKNEYAGMLMYRFRDCGVGTSFDITELDEVYAIIDCR
jgi:hypothetical protein